MQRCARLAEHIACNSRRNNRSSSSSVAAYSERKNKSVHTLFFPRESARKICIRGRARVVEKVAAGRDIVGERKTREKKVARICRRVKKAREDEKVVSVSTPPTRNLWDLRGEEDIPSGFFLRSRTLFLHSRWTSLRRLIIRVRVNFFYRGERRNGFTAARSVGWVPEPRAEFLVGFGIALMRLIFFTMGGTVGVCGPREFSGLNFLREFFQVLRRFFVLEKLDGIRMAGKLCWSINLSANIITMWF